MAKLLSAKPVEPAGRLVRDYGGAIVLAVAVALLIRSFVIEAYRIPSSAMKPTLESGDTIFVSKWPLGLFHGPGHRPSRGQVVVYTLKGSSNHDYIKRVIGVAGDVVEISHGHVILNGQALAYPSPGDTPSCAHEKIPNGSVYGVCWEPPVIEKYGPVTVPDGEVFVLGDLRSISPLDTKKTKVWGTVPISALKGEALWIWLSIEPRAFGSPASGFPQIRFDRMFRRVR